MGKDLNSISEDRLEETWNELLEEMEGLDFSKANIFAAETPLHLGLTGFALAKPREEYEPHFKKAAEVLSIAIAKQPKPDEGDPINPFDIDYYLGVILAFGSAEDKKRCADIQDWQLGTTDDGQEEMVHHVEYLKVLKGYVIGKPASDKVLSALISACEKSKRKEDKAEVLPAAKFLQAMNRKDVKGMAESIAKILEAHKILAKKGSLRKLPAGLASLSATGLCKLAKEQGYELDFGGNIPAEYLMV